MESKEKQRLIPLTQWTKHGHPWPSIAGLRHLFTHAKSKGCSNIFLKAGGRILVDEQAFFAWARSKGGQHEA